MCGNKKKEEGFFVLFLLLFLRKFSFAFVQEKVVIKEEGRLVWEGWSGIYYQPLK